MAPGAATGSSVATRVKAHGILATSACLASSDAQMAVSLAICSPRGIVRRLFSRSVSSRVNAMNLSLHSSRSAGSSRITGNFAATTKSCPGAMMPMAGRTEYRFGFVVNILKVKAFCEEL